MRNEILVVDLETNDGPFEVITFRGWPREKIVESIREMDIYPDNEDSKSKYKAPHANRSGAAPWRKK